MVCHCEESTANRPAWTQPEVVAGLDAVAAENLLPFIPIADGLPEAIEEAVEGEWRWGIAPVERLAATVADLFKRAMWLAPLAAGDVRARLRAHRADLSEWYERIQAFRQSDTNFWIAEAMHNLPEPPAASNERPEILRAWAREALRRWPVAEHDGGLIGRDDRPPDQVRSGEIRQLWEMAAGIARILTEAGPALRDVNEAEVPAGERKDYGLADLVAMLAPAVDGDEPADPAAADKDALRSLLRLEVAFGVFLVGDPELEQEVSLLHVTGNAPTSFAGDLEVGQKLAGVKLGHFGAFYKPSWRANDWIWGRLDGATKVVEAMLSPARLRQLGLDSNAAYQRVRELAVGTRHEDDHLELVARFSKTMAACEDELAFLSNPDCPLPPGLPKCSLAIARRIHLEILREELPTLRAAVTQDASSRAAPSNAARFADAYDAVKATHDTGLESVDAKKVFELFADARIAEETFEQEIGSDLFAATVSRAAAVGVSVADATRSGLGALKTITRPLRGFTLLLYALVHLATRGRFGRSLVGGALAVGGALVALTLLTDDTPALLTELGAFLVLAGLALAALRSRMWQFTLLLVVPAAALVLIVLSDPAGWAEALNERAGTITLIVGLVAAATLIGTVQRTPGPPQWLVSRQGLAICAAAIAGAVYVAWRTTGGWPTTATLAQHLELSLQWSPERAATAVGKMAGTKAADTSDLVNAVRLHARSWGWITPLIVASLLAAGLVGFGRGWSGIPGRRRRRWLRNAPHTAAWAVLLAGGVEILANVLRWLVVESVHQGADSSAADAIEATGAAEICIALDRDCSIVRDLAEQAATDVVEPTARLTAAMTVLSVTGWVLAAAAVVVLLAAMISCVARCLASWGRARAARGHTSNGASTDGRRSRRRREPGRRRPAGPRRRRPR